MKHSFRPMFKFSLGLATFLCAGLSQANPPVIKTLEVRQQTPVNQAYYVETSPNLQSWNRGDTLRFGTGATETFEVPVTDGVNGFVRLANVGQPAVGKSVWNLTNGNWATFSQTGGTEGYLDILTGNICRLGMEATGALPAVPYTYIRTGLDTATLKTAQKQVHLTWGTPSLGFYCQETLNASGANEETRCGAFSASVRIAIPTTQAGLSFVFGQNAEFQTLTQQGNGQWTLHKSGTHLPIVSSSYSLNGSTANLVLQFSESQRDEYQLNYNAPNGGSFTRQEIRGTNAIERLVGSFAVN